MYHMFQTSINVLKPEVVFVLGDLTDEAQYSSDEEFNNFVDRFYKLFAIPDNIKMYVISGNHDIGFHYRYFSYVVAVHVLKDYFILG